MQERRLCQRPLPRWKWMQGLVRRAGGADGVMRHQLVSQAIVAVMLRNPILAGRTTGPSSEEAMVQTLATNIR